MGRFIRKIKGGIRCLREHGIRYTAKLLIKEAAKRILPESFILLNKKFRDNVLAGFEVYSDLIEEYGDDVTILGCAFYGTGDYYISGLFLPEWLKKNIISNYIFLTPGGSEKKAAELFPSMYGHLQNIQLLNYTKLRIFRTFVGVNRQNFVYLHHAFRFPQNPALNITDNQLMGLHGLNMVDFYLTYGFELPEDTQHSTPVFDSEGIEELFLGNQLQIGRTVLLAPNSTGLSRCGIPEKFWKKLTTALQDRGYTVCTNCSENERPIEGTLPIFIPYKKIVPFLNTGGGYIGIRSGLCDIISASSCKKVVLHTYKSKWWPDGKSVEYTGLKNMGLCNDTLEIEYSSLQEKMLLEKIFNFIAGG